LSETIHPHWRSKFIGARQLSLLPEDELEITSRDTLLEILAHVQEVGPLWSACGAEFEVVLETFGEKEPASDLVDAVAGCMASGAPVRVLFRRDTAVSKSAETEDRDLLQTVSLNFPRAAVIAEGDDDRLVEWLEDRLTLAVQAHSAKKDLLTKMLKSGSLLPLVPFNQSGEGGRPLNLDRGLWGIGVWGLEEMTRFHCGESPCDSEESFRWLLEVIARLKLRMREIGERFGIGMWMVADTGEQVAERLLRSFEEVDFDLRLGRGEGFLEGANSKDDRLVREGKLSPFFAFGHSLSSVSGPENEWNVDRISERIRFLASSTHVSGMTLVGTFYCCRTCGGRFAEAVPVCDHCGGESVYEVTRKKRGTYTRFVRL